MTPEQLASLKQALPTMGLQEKLRVLELLDEYEKREKGRKARDSLLAFVKYVNPDYKVGSHHKILAAKLQAAAEGNLDRLATAIAPRFGKSLLLSLYFPAWFMGNFPTQKLIISSHTADLAVDFGKKVRNLIDSDDYKSIFPEVSLSADSKAAGSWRTNKGGEFFACIALVSRVETSEGMLLASEVCVGDVLFTSNGRNIVQAVYPSVHADTYFVAGLQCSGNHPIWTMNRGWVEAQKILPSDLLRTESFSDKLKALFWRAYGYLEHTRLPSLVQHQFSLRKSQQREVSSVRRARNLCLRTLETVRQFLSGYGRSAFSFAHSGAEGQRWPLQPGELPLGNAYRASQQQKQQCLYRGEDASSARSGFGHDAGSFGIQNQGGGRCIVSGEETTKELETYNPPKNTGWLASRIARFFKGSGGASIPGQQQNGCKKHLARARETAFKLCGLLLGVRPAGKVRVTKNTNEKFVNFLLDGDHTFFANGVLTHNCGVGGAVAGRGADLLIVDDPFSEQDVLNGNYDIFDKVYEWYAYGARTRLMPGGRVILLHTRWAKNDLIGRLIEESAKNPEADQWEYIEFPAVINEGTDNEKSLWPEQWSIEALKRTRASMPLFQWQAQYQQNPTSQQGALIKKEWWQVWKEDDAPDCDFVVMCLDAAQELNKRSDFTAITTWGVFYRDNDNGDQVANIILLNAINKRIEFPELKDLAMKEYKTWKPDSFLIEKKSNGAALFQELRRTGIPVTDCTPHRGTANNANNKFNRVNSVADIVRSGLVWAPEYRWAEEVIEQCNEFPSGKHDDLLDTVVMALTRFRNGGFIRLPSDDAEEYDFMPRKTAAYY